MPLERASSIGFVGDGGGREAVEWLRRALRSFLSFAASFTFGGFGGLPSSSSRRVEPDTCESPDDAVDEDDADDAVLLMLLALAMLWYTLRDRL